MQLAKSSTYCLFLLTLSWCGWASSEAQEISSRNNHASRPGYSLPAAKEVPRAIPVDSNPGTWELNRFIQQEDDRPSEDLEPDRDDEQTDEADDPDLSSLLDPVDDEEDDMEDEDDLDLDLDSEEDRRPPRPEFGPWPKKQIREINLDIRETSGSAPEDVSQQLMASSQSEWTQFYPQQKVFAWAAPDIRYQPLYFEDVALERYGTTAGPYHQSLISSFHFFKDFVFLPHKMRHDCPGSCDHPLGFCRPGNSTPYSIQRHYFGRPRWR